MIGIKLHIPSKNTEELNTNELYQCSINNKMEYVIGCGRWLAKQWLILGYDNKVFYYIVNDVYVGSEALQMLNYCWDFIAVFPRILYQL